MKGREEQNTQGIKKMMSLSHTQRGTFSSSTSFAQRTKPAFFSPPQNTLDPLLSSSSFRWTTAS